MSLLKIGYEPIYDLSQEEFAYFRDLIFQLAGINLGEKKKDLIVARLRSYLQKKGIGSFAEYRKLLEKQTNDHSEKQIFVNLLTTNKTDFFREPQHFSYLEEAVIPEWIASQNINPQIWCCASSTGEEPYTLSMVLNRHLPEGFDYKIMATDVDTAVLEKAQNGVYSQAKLHEIPETYQKVCLQEGKKKATGWFRIQDQIHQKIVFKRHNLIEPTHIGNEVFDVIFCRNVLIYFKQATIRNLMIKLHRSLKKDGLLFIGHSESIQGSGDLFKTIKPSIFRKI